MSTVNKLVLDAMGGDHAPDAILDGAAGALAAGLVTGDQLVLTGPRDQLVPLWAQRGATGGDAVEIVDAPDILGPNDSPVEAMKTKRRNSIAVGIELVSSRVGNPSPESRAVLPTPRKTRSGRTCP